MWGKWKYSNLFNFMLLLLIFILVYSHLLYVLKILHYTRNNGLRMAKRKGWPNFSVFAYQFKTRPSSFILEIHPSKLILKTLRFAKIPKILLTTLKCTTLRLCSCWSWRSWSILSTCLFFVWTEKKTEDWRHKTNEHFPIT